MAQTVITTDDLDGATNATTVQFSFQGKAFTIDLAKKNLAAFEKVMKPYLDAATPVRSVNGKRPGTSPRTRKTTASADSQRLADVRIWAAEQGWTVSSRGRIARDVVDAYNAAH